MKTKPGLKLYQASIDYDQILENYLRAKNEEVEVFQPLFTQRYTFDQNAQVYRFIFWFTQALFIGFVCFALIHLIFREFKSIIKALSILIVFGANCTSVKLSYLKIKLVDILFIMSLVGLSTFGLQQIGLTLNENLIQIDCGAVVLIISVVSLADIVCCVRLRQKSISKYFKN